MRERILPDETLTFGHHPRSCLNCGTFTHFEWLEAIAFCSLDCLEAYAQEWRAEMEEGPDERTEYEQRIDAAPATPDWWPQYIYEMRIGGTE